MMQRHLTEQEVESYQRRAVAAGERSALDRHLTACDACLRRVVDATRSNLAYAALTEAFLPAADEEPFHLSREELKRYAAGALGQADRIILESHLEDCVECGGAARELLLIESGGTSRQAHERPGGTPKTVWQRLVRPWRRLPSLRPAHVGGIAAACVCVLLIVLWSQSRFSGGRGDSSPQHVAGSGDRDQNQNAPTPQGDQTENRPQAQEAKSDDEKASGEAAHGTLPTSQPRRLQAAPGIVVSLIDGGGEVTLDRQGNLTGLEGLDPSTRREVKAALSGNDLKRPASLDDLTSPNITLLGQPSNTQPFGPLHPVGILIADDRPAFHWRHLPGATDYTVSVFDSNFNRVMVSTPQGDARWSPPEPLQRGKTYFWEVTARKDDREVTSPIAPAPRAKFKVLEESKVEEINLLEKERPNSHLVLGLIYARAGLLDDAEREFRLLVNANPRSRVAGKLLRRVQSWKKP